MFLDMFDVVLGCFVMVDEKNLCGGYCGEFLGKN